MSSNELCAYCLYKLLLAMRGCNCRSSCTHARTWPFEEDYGMGWDGKEKESLFYKSVRSVCMVCDVM